MLRIISTGDWHLDGDAKRNMKARASLDQIVEYTINTEVDGMQHNGDIWETMQRHMEGSGVETCYSYLREISKRVDWLSIVKGNNSHDKPGSISLLHKLESNIFAYEYPVLLDPYTGKDLLRNEIAEDYKPQILISMVPYPTKAMLIQDASIDQNNQTFGEAFDGLMTMFGMINDKYNCFKTASFHGNVQGSRLSSGQSLMGQDIIISPLSLVKMKCHFYGLNHIHLYQELRQNMIYAGGLYNCNYGETEQKYFNVITYDDGKIEIEAIPLKAARPMINVKANFINGKFEIAEGTVIPEGAEVKFKYSVNEGDRGLVTDELLKTLTDQYGEDCKIDSDVIPIQRETRSEKIMTAANLLEEVTEYAEVTKQEMTKSIAKKVNDIEASAELVTADMEI